LECKDFQEVENTILFRIIFNYQKSFEELEEVIDKERKVLFVNQFQFGDGSITGIKGMATNTFMHDGYLCKANIFHIGPYVNVQKIRELIAKKIYSNNFKYKSCGKNNLISRKDKKEKLHLQSMNI
jgi:hypothetical protein